MNIKRDPNLLIGAWLDEGPRDLPSDTRRAIETAVRTIPQRRRGLGLSWRVPNMNGALRPVLLVATILISVAGFALYGSVRPVLPGGAPTVSPSVRPSFGPSPSPQALIGRIAFTRSDAQIGMYGNYLGSYTANADGTNFQRLALPADSDGIYWSPDGRKLLLGNSPPSGGLGFRPVVVNADGSGYTRLKTPGTFGDMYCSAWSPDGSRLLCGIADANDPSVGGIVTIDAATGTDMRRLSSGAPVGVTGTKSQCAGGDSPGDFSPDGTQFVFVRHACGTKPDPVVGERAAVYVGKTDGSDTPHWILYLGGINSGEPQISWSPDGRWLLFGDPGGQLFVMHPDGTGWAAILPSVPMGTYMYSPDWSPDGSRIIFSAWHEGDTTDLYTAKADGTDVRRLTHDSASEDTVSWGPPAP